MSSIYRDKPPTLAGWCYVRQDDDDDLCDMAWIADVVEGFIVVDCWEMGRTIAVKTPEDVCVACLRCGTNGPLKVTIEAFADQSLNLKQVVLYNPTRGKFRMACRLIDVNPFKKKAMQP